MTYVVKTAEQVDGELPHNPRYEPDSNYTAGAGEVAFSDANWEGKQGYVWDATNQTLRAPSTADNLRWAKRDKRMEMEHAFANNMEQIMPIWLALARMAKNLSSTDPRFAKVSSGHDQLQTIYTQIQNGDTPNAVNNITWNQVS